MSRKNIVSLVILTILCVIFVLTIAYFFIISGAIFSLRPTPPEPKETYGEFPVQVVIEVDGEIKEIRDTVICEFEGFEKRGSAGIYHKWKSRLKSGNERLILLKGKEGDTDFEIYTEYGQPEYYMGDLTQYEMESYEKSIANDRELGIIYCKGGVQRGELISKENVLEKYKLKIISKEYSKPIDQ